MINISEEKTVDYELTARVATEAFDSDTVAFNPARMKWLYERGFGPGTVVLAVTDDRRKVGQIAVLHQTLQCNGKPCSTVQLVDLFLAKDHRSPQLIRRIYKEVEQFCIQRSISFIVGVPNENAKLLNARYLKLKPALWLDVRMGAALLPPNRAKLKYSGTLKSLSEKEAIDLLSGFETSAEENGLRWDGRALFDRLSDPTCDYAVHAGANLLLISSARKTRGINHALLCGFFARPAATVASGDIRQLIRAAGWFWKRPLFVYAGINDRLPELPGFVLPARLRPPMLVQLRGLDPEMPELRLGRFQLIDSDFV
jgi:hypothetical protein